MAHYNVFVQDSSPLFTYSPPGAWVDTPLVFDNSPSRSYHATRVQGATVELDFVGTGVQVFSATVPTPGSYEVYVDDEKLSGGVDSTSTPDSQLLLGSIAGLKMGPHRVTLVNSGVTGDVLEIGHVEVESVVTTGSTSLSTTTFDDTFDKIQWGSGWVSTGGPSTFYNSTIHYTGQPDAKMGFSFEGDAIAIYGTAGVEIGDYVVTLDGQSRTFNGGSKGSVRIPHDQTILYLANGLSAGRHELAITANPSSLGKPQVFSVDSIRVLSGSSSSGSVLLSPGSSNTGTSSTLPPPVSTGSSYTSLISSTVFPESTPLPTSTSPTLSPSLMPPPSFTSLTLTPPKAQLDSAQSSQGLQLVSDNFKVLTDKGVISSAIISAIVAAVGLIFFALFLWKRKTLDPPSYIDIEKGDKPEKGPRSEPGEASPELPIQLAEKASLRSEENDDPFGPYAHYRGSLADRKPGHSRNGSYGSSITANESAYSLYRETLEKRALLTNSISSLDSTRRGSLSDRDSTFSDGVSSIYSDGSRYSQMSERIIINDVRMPPQFATPMRPPSVAAPLRPKYRSPTRPPRVRDSLALPF